MHKLNYAKDCNSTMLRELSLAETVSVSGAGEIATGAVGIGMGISTAVGVGGVAMIVVGGLPALAIGAVAGALVSIGYMLANSSGGGGRRRIGEDETIAK